MYVARIETAATIQRRWMAKTQIVNVIAAGMVKVCFWV
jgi:hypothetical protein